MLALAVLTGVSLTLNVCTLAGVAYALYRYSFAPWKVMRLDIKALDVKIEELRQYIKNELGLRAARVLNDEELARVEAAQRRQAVWSKVGG